MPHFTTKLTVRTYECDQYGHVNNATFLNYLEYARVELLREMGYSLNSFQKMGLLLLVVKIEIGYKRPAYPLEELELSIEWTKRGKSSSVFHQQIRRTGDNQVVADAQVTWVVTDLKGVPTPIPDEMTETYRRKFNADI